MSKPDKLKKQVSTPPRKLSVAAKQFLQETLMDAQADREECCLALLDELDAKVWPQLQQLLVLAFPDDERTGQALSTALIEHSMECGRRLRALAKTLSQEPIAVLAQRRRSRAAREHAEAHS